MKINKVLTPAMRKILRENRKVVKRIMRAIKLETKGKYSKKQIKKALQKASEYDIVDEKDAEIFSIKLLEAGVIK